MNDALFLITRYIVIRVPAKRIVVVDLMNEIGGKQ